MLKKIKFFFFLFFLYIYILIFWNTYNFFFPIIDGVNISELKLFSTKYPKLKEIKLNYSYKCGEILKYGKNNNKRDLVMFSYKSKRDIKRSLLIYIVIDSIKRNIPNAKIICFIPENSYIDFVIKLLKKNNVLIIKEKDFLNK